MRQILVVDDHAVVRQGITTLLQLRCDNVVTLEAEDVASALSQLATQTVDLVIADLFLAGRSGLDLVKEAKVHHPRLPILMLSMHRDPLLTQRALRAGARGYVLKSSPIEVLIRAVDKVLLGEIFVDQAIAGQVLEQMAAVSGSGSLPERLTDRELEVFRLIGEGQDSRSIAASLNLSPRTVESHRVNIRMKLGLQGANELLLAAARWVDSTRGTMS